MKKTTKRLTALCLAFVTTICAASVRATTIKDLEEKKAENNIQIQTAKDLLEDTQMKKSDVLSEVLALDTEMDTVVSELEFVTNELEKTETLLAQTEVELAEAIELREKQFQAMSARLRYLYENGSISYLQVIFEAKSFQDLIDRTEYVTKIIEYDRTMAQELKETEALISRKLQDTELQKLEIEALRNQQIAKIASLEEALDARNQVLIALNLDEQTYAQQIKDLESDNKAFEQLIKEKQAEEARKAAAAAAAARSNIVITGGSLLWPVSGYASVNSPYGWRSNPFNGSREFHTGVDLKAPLGTNIFAAESGTVISSGYRNGYGYTVVIDHGNGISTLYAHASQLLVSAGDYVERGKVIMKAGSTGYSTGPHLHFEVRVNGSPVSPNTYIGIK